MKKKIAILAIGLLVTTGMASVAVAADTGFYVMGGLGQQLDSSTKSNADAGLTSIGGRGFSSSVSEATVYRVQLGYQVNTNLAIEGGYIGTDDESYSASGGNVNGTIRLKQSVKAWNLTAVGLLPVADKFSLLGKLGYANVKASATITNPTISLNSNNTKNDFTYGIGAKYDITKEVFTRLDVDSYNIADSTSSSRTNVWMLNIGYKF
jgi:OOP family OmpA-OmpF porin